MVLIGLLSVDGDFLGRNIDNNNVETVDKIVELNYL